MSKNGKGGFDVHNFGLIPTVVVEDGKNEPCRGKHLIFMLS